MAEQIVGHCPKCGCPIYQEEYYAGSGHAPVVYSCNCNESEVTVPLVKILGITLEECESRIQEARAETLKEVGELLDKDGSQVICYCEGDYKDTGLWGIKPSIVDSLKQGQMLNRRVEK